MPDIDREVEYLIGETKALRALIRSRPEIDEDNFYTDKLAEATSRIFQFRRIIRQRDKEHTKGKDHA